MGNTTSDVLGAVGLNDDNNLRREEDAKDLQVQNTTLANNQQLQLAGLEEMEKEFQAQNNLATTQARTQQNARQNALFNRLLNPNEDIPTNSQMKIRE